MGNAESRIAFSHAVTQLYEAKDGVPATDTAFWARLFAGPTSIDEVFAMVAPRDVRSIITKAPVNMKMLVLKSVEIIVKATTTTTDASTTALDRAQQDVLSNAIRVLVRVLPFVFEDRGYNWKQELFQQPLPGSTSAKTLAEELVDRLYILLFLPGFSLPPNVAKRKDGTYFIIWETGIAAKSAPPSTVEIDTNRTEVLKLMLVLMSPVLYMSSAEMRTNGNWWTTMLIQRANPTIVMAVLASLLNVICAYDPVGYGMPYNYVFFADTRESFVETCLHVLLVLIDFCYPVTGDAAVTTITETIVRPHEDDSTERNDGAPAGEHDLSNIPTASVASSVPTAVGNIYQEYISRIHRKEDFAVLIAGLTRLMKTSVGSMQTYLPGAMKRVRFTNDLVYFVWKFLELNKRFFSHILRDPALLDIILPLLYFMWEARNDEGKVGIVHVIAFTLLMLSGDRNFGVRLNKAYDHSYSVLKLATFEGNHADVLILVLHQVIVDGHRSLTQLYDCMLTIIANVAPYVKSISSVTSHKLLSMLRMFTAPKFLLASPSNCELSLVLLDALNNMVQYQFDGNTRLIYAILRNQRLFQAIYDLNLHTALSKMNVTSASESLDSNNTTSSEATGPHPSASPSNGDDLQPPLTRPNITPIKTALSPAVLAAAEAVAAMAGGSTDNKPTVSASPQRWMPTEEWMFHYKSRMPLMAIMRLLQVLVPQVEQVCKEMNINSEETVLQFLGSGTLVGLLPLPSPIMIRRYKPNTSTYVWSTVNLWGSIYLANLEPPIWYGTQVGLFTLRTIE